MKRVWISGGILIVIFAWVTFGRINLTNIVNSAVSSLNLSEKCISDKNYSCAKTYFDKAYSEWEQAGSFLGAVAKHSEIDQIIIDFEQADAYLKCEKYEDFVANIYAVRRRISHIEHMEKANIGNIF